MGKGVELTGKNKEKIYPVTASDLVYDKDTKKNIKTSLNEKVEEAPMDGKQYARFNGAWAEVEAGAVSETAIITLTPAVDGLKGVSVTVTTSEGETVLNTTWQGAALTAQIRAGLQYTVAVGSKDGFIAPESVTYTAVKGLSRSINMAYTESMLKVNILSNQDNDTTIAAVKATVTYGSTTVQVANGGEVYLPLNVDVAITFPTVDGYKTPDTITYTHTGGSYEKSGTYQTELVTVALSADNGASVSGQTVTINGTTHTWAGTAITQKVAFGTTYTVSVNDKDGYATPASQSATSSQSTRNFSFVYYYIPGTRNPGYGVYIQTKDGLYLTSSEWSNIYGLSPNGIAVITEECSFVIALKDLSVRLNWCDEGSFSEVPNVSLTEDYAQAILDYDGDAQTTAMINSLGKGTCAYFAREYTFPNGKNGYLGAAGEWQVVINNINEINNLLKACSEGSTLSDSNWTSTQYGAYDAWSTDLTYYDIVIEPKQNSLYIRPFTSL